jgi:acrylyl-CoA reductase (NADPH)
MMQPSAVMQTFRALVVRRTDGGTSVAIEEWSPDQLMPGEVTVRVEYSSINYKDGLAARPDGRVARRYPLIPGIDLAGTVVSSDDPRYRPGDRVLVHGYELGAGHHGGYAALARVPAAWVVPLPAGLSPRQAMAIGTAGVTAALSVVRLEHLGLRPERGPVLVTGAAGGVGSTAVAILAARGYDVAASTGRPACHDFLRQLGARRILDRSETSAAGERPLEHARWAGAIDSVGGATLAYLLRTTSYGGSIAACGLAGGSTLHTTVFPFILRGVSLLGIDSAHLPLPERIAIWRRLAGDLRPPQLEELIATEVSLDDVPRLLQEILQGAVRGRVVVRVAV